MRIPLLVLWLMLPIGGIAYHEGPGQDRLKLDEVDTLLASAHDSAVAKDFGKAIEAYDKALAGLPAEHESVARHIRLERSKAWMLASKLPDARAELETLVDEIARDAKPDTTMLAEARRSLANAHYYTTWLMRLEGMPREVWEPEIDGARQQYRLLAEGSTVAADTGVQKKSKQDLEAAVLLSRLEIEELQGLPIPGQ
ncbi:MAG: hypothetical protein U1F36_16275 [Planctomycetota bacterium]